MSSMKRYSKLLLAVALMPVAMQSIAAESIAMMKPEDVRLPDAIKVYYSENHGVSKKPFKGAKADVLPTNNEYKDAPGCYIACYSNNPSVAPKLGAYPVGGKNYMMGQIRVEGHYHNGLCIPKGYENKDVRTSKEMKEACEKSFPAMCEKATCTANGLTANWFW